MTAAPSVVFVCQAGRLAAQALLLGASLRMQRPSLNLLAAVPGELPPATRQALRVLGIATVPISNPLAQDYPIGHKLAALAADEPDGPRVFLDSDMLCLAPIEIGPLTAHPFAAKPADIATFGDAAMWGRLYHRFGLPQPTLRVAATVSGDLMLPYFNAGMLATNEPRYLSAAWIDACRAIDAMPDIEPKRPWLDQIGLPLAVARLGLAMRTLSEAWNYPAHIKPLSGVPALVHYHVPEVVEREPALLACVADVMRRWPAVAEVVTGDVAWTGVVRSTAHGRVVWVPGHAVRVRNDDGEGDGGRLRVDNAGGVGGRARTGAIQLHRYSGAGPDRSPECGVSADSRGTDSARDLLLTGIPRSGTSYLCKLLDGFGNVAVINEPEALFEGLARSPEPWAIPLLHADLRARIRAGQPVANKLDASGALAEDTACDATTTEWRPTVGGNDFILATKNTLAYLARLDGIRRVMPGARVVALVRHPLDTLASWKAGFAHLASGNSIALPIGGLADPFLPARLRCGLEQVAALGAGAVRRAAWWRLLADEILLHRNEIEVVHYEDLVANPEGTLASVLGPLAAHAGDHARPPAPSVPRAGRDRLDAEDWQAAALLCTAAAEAFGYAMPAFCGVRAPMEADA